MSNQIVISSGAKVRDLNGVLTATSGIVSSVPLGAANGVATLDSGGKVPVSQLPSSVVTYLGTWDAATNTPTLVNGTGDAGDMYICNVAGTVNFGAGPVTFAVGDWVLYGSGTWQKSNGQNGTVTSVAVTESGDALTITGSPITTSGTINIGFAGTSGQYVNGAGGLTTFPSLTGFVPYTGATANVDLGTNTLTALGVIANNFSAIGNTNPSGNGGYIFLKQGIGPFTNDTGYNSITANSTRFLLQADAGSSNNKLASFELSGLTNNTSRTYTLPDLSGTFALLEGTQTFTGVKSFDTGVLIKNGVSPTASGYTGIGAGTSGISVSLGAGGGGSLIFQSTSYNYTFPAASGTIALTSNIPSITGLVPYTGATANVNLGTFDLTADVITGATGSFASSGGSDSFAINHSSGSGIALNITKGGNGEGLYINKTSGSGNAVTIIGTLNATTLVKSGGTSSQFLMADGSVNTSVLPSGAYLPLAGGTLTGALSGTSATFSDGISITKETAATNTRIVVAQLGRATSGTAAAGIGGYLQFLSEDTAGAQREAAVISWDFSNSSSATPEGRLYLGTRGANDALTILNTGAATFSSSVDAGGGVIISGNASISSTARAIWGNTYLQFNSGSTGISFNNSNNTSGLVTILNGGNVGIGTSSPSSILTILKTITTNYGAKGNGAISLGTAGSANEANLINFGYDAESWQPAYMGYLCTSGAGSSNGALVFATRSTTTNVQPTERIRITSGGFLKASNTGTYLNSTSTNHELVNSIGGNYAAQFSNTNSTSPFGIQVYYPNTLNNTSNRFIDCEDNTALRFSARSNGGLANYQANDVNLSDERTKKDIIPLESYWDKFKAIEIVKFKYKDQTHDDFNIGVIAQQVEKVAPEFVDVDGWDNKPKLDEDGNIITNNEEPLKSIYTADLHHATIKVLQECMSKIEEQQAQIEELKELIKNK